jgi:hypothetical protein
MAEESCINKDQLNLLMLSYKESVELSTRLLGKLDNVVDIQRESCKGINKLCDKIDQQTSTLVTHNIKLEDKLVDMKINIVKEHGVIRNKLYVAFSLMGTIIIGLITTIYKLFTP